MNDIRTGELYEKVKCISEYATQKNGKPVTIETFEKVNAVIIPDNPTNGDMIKALFDCKLEDEFSISYLFKIENNRYCTQFDKKWWNAPYKLSKPKGK